MNDEPRFSSDDLAKIDHIVVHDNCADGMASAILLMDALPGRTLTFVQYGTKEHRELEAKPGMLFCDITPHESNLDAFLDADAIVLDHHKTARELVSPFAERGVFADEKLEPGVSGAMLAYRHVWRPASTPIRDDACRLSCAHSIALLAGIRDTWQRNDPLWDAADNMARVLFWVPKADILSRITSTDDADWDALAHLLLRDHDLHRILRQKRREELDRAHAHVWRWRSFGDARCALVPSVTVTSDLVDELDDVQLLIGFTFVADGPEPRLVCSARSREHEGRSYDCAGLAKRHGGGGHTQAAGFSLPAGNPYADIPAAVTLFDARY